MAEAGAVLMVDDDQGILTAGRLLLKRRFAEVITCGDPRQIPRLMAERSFDVILLDMNFGPGESDGAQGFFWLERILAIDPQAVVILITAHGGVNVAVEAMKRGGTDFMLKPWENERMLATLSTALKLRRTRTEAQSLRQANRVLSELSGIGNQPLLGKSPAMQSMKQLIERAAPTDANILILGENGTGKELVARALHEGSPRANAVFIPVDLGAISENLFESELFGHKKGAFTDAREDRVGRLVAADGGTLFLDEIGNLPLHLQAKLLTVLEQRRVTPLGSNSSITIDVRMIAATNLPRQRLHDENYFRQDLLFRLNTVEILVPPLRERGQDILDIAEHYTALYARKYGKPAKAFSASALSALLGYAWPGNVRALRHAVERAVILSPGDLYEAGDFSLIEPEYGRPDRIHPANPARASAQAQSATQRENPEPERTTAENLNLEQMELSLIKRALTKHGFNISHAAKELGLTRAALYRRMEKYGL